MQQGDLNPGGAGRILVRMPDEYAVSSVIHFAENDLPDIDSGIFLRDGKIKSDASACHWKDSGRQRQTGGQLIDGRLRGEQAWMARRNRQGRRSNICSRQ
ncbi:MAG: hypothetical protein RR376_07595 [Janthinobacterium sp.]